jgi:hypothetical protein
MERIIRAGAKLGEMRQAESERGILLQKVPRLLRFCAESQERPLTVRKMFNRRSDIGWDRSPEIQKGQFLLPNGVEGLGNHT